MLCDNLEGCECVGRCAAATKSLQSSLTLCDPIDGSPPGSPTPEILQVRQEHWSGKGRFKGVET